MKWPWGHTWQEPPRRPKPGLHTQARSEAEYAEFCPQTKKHWLAAELHKAPCGHLEQTPPTELKPESQMQEPSNARELAPHWMPATQTLFWKKKPVLQTQTPKPLLKEFGAQVVEELEEGGLWGGLEDEFVVVLVVVVDEFVFVLLVAEAGGLDGGVFGVFAVGMVFVLLHALWSG